MGFERSLLPQAPPLPGYQIPQLGPRSALALLLLLLLPIIIVVYSSLLSSEHSTSFGDFPKSFRVAN